MPATKPEERLIESLFRVEAPGIEPRKDEGSREVSADNGCERATSESPDASSDDANYAIDGVRTNQSYESIVDLERRLAEATAVQDWVAVAQIASALAARKGTL
ncbi:MAG TPA: hypothetical protein VKP30_12590 [Polyangiaceae bacterium]|nr:hypothetical protein [Polyangiaceae bacterium]